MTRQEELDLISQQVQNGLDRIFSQFSIDEKTIKRKVNHDGRIYYDFYVSMKGRENQGKFEYWPDTKGWPKGYVEIWEDAWYLGDQIMVELADTYLTKWMKEYHDKMN